MEKDIDQLNLYIAHVLQLGLLLHYKIGEYTKSIYTLTMSVKTGEIVKFTSHII